MTQLEVAGVGGSCKFHQRLALQPQDMELHQQTYWQLPALLLSMTHRSKSIALQHGTTSRQDSSTRCPTCERTQDLKEMASLAPSSQMSFLLPQQPQVKKLSRTGCHFSGV